MTSHSAEFLASAAACPECGTAGKPEPGMAGGRFGHVETPAHCHTYTWDKGGVIARDVSSKGERDAKADAFDARIKSLNPFRRK